MTGSVFVYQRQSSSTIGDNRMKKSERPPFRRYSSADESSSLAPVPDDQYEHVIINSKKNQVANEDDSGAEDLSQPEAQYSPASMNAAEADDQASLFSSCDDEANDGSTIVEQEAPNYPMISPIEFLQMNAERAVRVKDNDKKDFCENTKVVFHGEFAYKILAKIAAIHGICPYALFSECEFGYDLVQMYGYAFSKVDNAKAQFKCETCQRSWTSMRSRIVFHITWPFQPGIITLKIFGQLCENCRTMTQPLWYMEEVCRVVDNLAQCIFYEFFPDLYKLNYNFQVQGNQQGASRIPSRIPHDPHQRKGKMNRPHDSNKCEACMLNMCFPQCIQI